MAPRRLPRRRSSQDNPRILEDLITGHRVAQALSVAARLGIADLLADGPRTSADLARATGTNPDALYRLLRALARKGVFDEQAGRSFALTPEGNALRADVPGSRRAQAIFSGSGYVWAAWAELSHSVETGDSAFAFVHGQSAWEYRAQHPEDSAVFDAWMTAQTRAADAAIVDGYDFGRFSHVVDVGGGQGALLEAILAANPHLHGTLFDQEHVVAAAPVHERARVVSGSFFESVPRGGDAYVLKSIVHDWADDEAVRILRAVAAALDGDARVLLVERDLGDPASAWMDLQMLVMLGGRERTPEEYAALFTAAGLEPVGFTPAGAGFCVFEARRP
jgi:hypothetical protein